MAQGPTNLQGLNTFLSLGGGGGGGMDLSSAFQTGASAAGGGADDTSDDDGSQTGGAGLGSISPLLIALTKHQMANMSEDDSPTSEDKGLALAQAGFSMAAGQSPHALSNIGAGASSGIEALQKAKQQRALQRMREAQLGQNTALREAALVDAARQKAASLALSKDQKQAALDQKTASDAEKADIARQRAQDAKDAAAARAGEAADRAQALKDRQDALAEQRYVTNDRMRRDQYQKSGQWAKIAGDDEHGVSGAPTEDTYTGPQVTDPTLPLKDRNAMRKQQPAQTQAVKTVSQALDNVITSAQDLAKHPGLSNAVGFGGETMSKIPGTDAASFAAKLNSLKSQEFAKNIQAMRDASKTGGAVGNVSDREGDRFENMVASLSQAQDEKQFKEGLDKLVQYSKFLKSTYVEKYKSTYGDIPGVAEQKADSPANVDDDPLGLRGNK